MATGAAQWPRAPPVKRRSGPLARAAITCRSYRDLGCCGVSRCDIDETRILLSYRLLQTNKYKLTPEYCNTSSIAHKNSDIDDTARGSADLRRRRLRSHNGFSLVQPIYGENDRPT
eukprot:6184092-Pleurochrysis_carterae.AAC.1